MCAALLRVPRVQAVLSALSLMTASAAGQEGQAGVHWIFPPASGDTMTFHHNDTINVTYTSSFSTPVMYTFCQGEHVDRKFSHTWTPIVALSSTATYLS